MVSKKFFGKLIENEQSTYFYIKTDLSLHMGFPPLFETPLFEHLYILFFLFGQKWFLKLLEERCFSEWILWSQWFLRQPLEDSQKQRAPEWRPHCLEACEWLSECQPPAKQLRPWWWRLSPNPVGSALHTTIFFDRRISQKWQDSGCVHEFERVSCKRPCQKLLSGFLPLRGGGYPPIPLSLLGTMIFR